VKKTALSVFLALCLAPAMALAQTVVVHATPPPPVIENHDHPLHPGWVWHAGYHRWEGNHYVWVKGFWVDPPRPGAVWVPHRWEHQGDHWVLIEGHWEYPKHDMVYH
jgi:WXXGXW repeat (2 copies)